MVGESMEEGGAIPYFADDFQSGKLFDGVENAGTHHRMIVR